MIFQNQEQQKSPQQLTIIINEFLNFNSSKSQNKNQLKQVQTKLKQFSKSPHFFQTAFQFIMTKNDSTYQQLFIVTLLLRDKFRYQFDKYSDQAQISYLENLIKQIIKKYSQLPPDTFSTNICVCIICLYIKRAEQLRNKFKQIGILEYFKSFVGQGICSDYFYKALQYAPEEVFSSKIVMDQVRKDRVRAYVKASQYQVLKHLNSVAAQLWQKKIIKKNHLFTCLQNWIEIGYKQNLYQQLPNHFLVQKLFQNCLDSPVSSEATECLRCIIKKLKSSKKDEVLFSFLGSGVLKLVNSINLYIKENGDYIQANQAIQVVADFGLLAISFFVENYNQEIKNFLQSTIFFLKLQQIDAYLNLIDFWSGFITQVQKSQQFNPEFQILFKNLYATICFKTAFTYPMIQKMNQISQRNLGKFYNEAEYIIQRRAQTQNLFQALACYFGKQQYIGFVFACISQLKNQKPQQFWPFLQSYLNSLRLPVKNVASFTNNIKTLVQSYRQIQRLNPSFIAIKVAYLHIFRNLMSIKEQDFSIKSQFVAHLFQIIAQNLSNPKLQEKAQKAFSKGCQQNSQIVLSNIEGFINLLKSNNGNEQIVKGIMHVLTSNQQAMRKYLISVLEVLYQVFNDAHQSNSNTKKKQAYHSLYSMFKILMRCENKSTFRQSIFQFTKLIWPTLLASLNLPKDTIDDEDPEIQRAVKLVKFIMRCLRQEFQPFLESLFNTVKAAYQKFPICSYIYVLEVSITVFYETSHLYSYFCLLYKDFCKLTYHHLKEKQQKIASYQLLIDDFIGMNKRFFIYNSQVVLESGQLPMLIQTCINLSNIQDVPQVSKSAYQFFETIFMVYWSNDFIESYNKNECGSDPFQKNVSNQQLYQQLKHYIVPKLSQLIIRMIKHLQTVPLQATTHCILDCLMSQIKGFSQVNGQIWTPILQQIPQQILTMTQKSQIYENLQKVGSLNIQQARDAAQRLDRLVYIMNKRFINNHKRKI